jgi:ABC-type transport system substrate-binding protein
MLQQQWREIGVKATIRTDANADALAQLALDGKCDAWFSFYAASYPTMIELVSQYYVTGGPSNATGYSNAQVDQLTGQARRTTDRMARDTLLAQVEQIIGDDAAHVFLQSVNWLMGVDVAKVRNFHYSGVHGTYYDRLWLA